jgi:hypothetical protein
MDEEDIVQTHVAELDDLLAQEEEIVFKQESESSNEQRNPKRNPKKFHY